MNADPTTDEVRQALAELLGWWFSPGGPGSWPRIYRPDEMEAPGHVADMDAAGVPDPAADLNAMAAVEAALRERGLAHSYLARLLLHGAEPAVCIDLTEEAVWAAVTAPAAVRALAAFRVLKEARQ